MSDIDQMLSEKGLNFPRITREMAEDQIVSEHYFTAADGVYGAYRDGPDPLAGNDVLNRITFCVLVLRNGFTTVGQSACVHPGNFDAEIGKTIARRNAVDKIYPLLGYQLAWNIYNENAMRGAVLPNE